MNQTERRRGLVMPVQRPWPPGLVSAVRLGLVVAVIAFWEAGVRLGLIDAFFWSSPAAIYRTAVIYVPRWSTFVDAEYTIGATLAGFLIGTLGGAAIGLAFWWSRNWASVFEPLFVVFNAIPKLALAPLLILLFGIGITSKIALAVALTIVTSVLAAGAGVRAVDEDLVRMMHSLGATRWQVFTKVVMPSVGAWVVSSMRLNIGLALTGVIVGEFVSAQHGIGKVIMYAGSTYEMALIWVGVLILSVVAAIMYVGVGWIEQRLLRWIAG